MEPIPKKINERPSVWLGLTGGELFRTGACFALGSFFAVVLPIFLIFRTFPSFLVGVLCCVVISALGLYFSAKVMSKNKSGKPFGFSDQRFALRMARLGLKKIPCVHKSCLWFHKRNIS